MFVAAVIISLLLAVSLVASATAALAEHPAVMANMATVGVKPDQVRFLAYAQVAGAVGILAGLSWWPIGVAASVGVAAFFLGALAAHVRVRDRMIVAPMSLLIVAIASLVLRSASR